MIALLERSNVRQGVGRFSNPVTNDHEQDRATRCIEKGNP